MVSRRNQKSVHRDFLQTLHCPDTPRYYCLGHLNQLRNPCSHTFQIQISHLRSHSHRYSLRITFLSVWKTIILLHAIFNIKGFDFLTFFSCHFQSRNMQYKIIMASFEEDIYSEARHPIDSSFAVTCSSIRLYYT